MTEVDSPPPTRRRDPLRVSATAVPAIALAGASISPAAAWAESAAHLSPHAMATLVLMARDIYPHDQVADLSYIRAVAHWDAKSGGDPAIHAMVTDGIARLDADSRERHGCDYLGLGEEADRIDLLRDLEGTRFFSAIRADLIPALYNQSEIWPRFGQAGPRRVHDIDWLPTV